MGSVGTIWALPDKPYILFRVYGTPQTKGSAKAVKSPHMRFAVVLNDNTKNKGWAALVGSVAQDHAPEKLWTGAVGVYLHFYLYPPKALLKREKYKHTFPCKKPDIDKMTRSIYDALTGIIFKDDNQIVNTHEVKSYSESPGVEIMITNLEEGAL